LILNFRQLRDKDNSHGYTTLGKHDFPSIIFHTDLPKRRATAVPNSVDRIKFDFSTAVARRLKPSCATAVPNSIHKL